MLLSSNYSKQAREKKVTTLEEAARQSFYLRERKSTLAGCPPYFSPVPCDVKKIPNEVVVY
jgi:hypothetical protein